MPFCEFTTEASSETISNRPTLRVQSLPGLPARGESRRIFSWLTVDLPLGICASRFERRRGAIMAINLQEIRTAVIN